MTAVREALHITIVAKNAKKKQKAGNSSILSSHYRLK
jgi:hypothetical protein